MFPLLSDTYLHQVLAARVLPPSLSSPLWTLLAIAALIAIPLCLYAVAKALPQIMALMQTPLLAIAQTAPGPRLVRVKGRLRCADPLRSRIDGLHCLYASIAIWEEIHRDHNRLELVKVGDFGEAWASDPAVEDDSGRLAIRFDHPQIDFAQKRRFYTDETVSPALDMAFTDFIADRMPDDAHLHGMPRNFFQETYLPCDVPVTLWGYRIRGDAALDGSGQALTDALLVTRISHMSDLRTMARPLAQILICGSAMIAFGLAFARHLL